MAEREIKDLPLAATIEESDTLTGSQDGFSVRFSVAQVLGLIGADKVVPAIAGATSDDSFDDADEVVYLSGAHLKRGTLTGLISSVFKTARTIASAQFAAATFKLFNGAVTPRALSFDLTALTADRVLKFPDKDINSIDCFTFGIKRRLGPTADRLWWACRFGH
jgi:hypothetical protein